jgi:hypothetical protein
MHKWKQEYTKQAQWSNMLASDEVTERKFCLQWLHFFKRVYVPGCAFMRVYAPDGGDG